MPRFLAALPLLILASGLPAREARAQMFSYEERERGSVQSLGAGVQLVRFGYADGGNPAGEGGDFYRAPALAVHYVRPGFQVSVAYGLSGANDASEASLRFVDAALSVWGEFALTASRRFRLSVPILIHSSYRGVEDRGGSTNVEETFNISTIGLGTGLAVFARAGERTVLEARATPVLGLALRTVQGTAGSTWLADADVQLHRENLVGRFGLSLGAGLRLQRWRVRPVDALPGTEENRFDYRGLQHVLRIGVNW